MGDYLLYKRRKTIAVKQMPFHLISHIFMYKSVWYSKNSESENFPESKRKKGEDGSAQYNFKLLNIQVEFWFSVGLITKEEVCFYSYSF